MHALAVRHVAARVHRHDVAEADTEVLAHDLVHAHVRVLAGLIREDDTDRLVALLALDDDGVAAEELRRGGGRGW